MSVILNEIIFIPGKDFFVRIRQRVPIIFPEEELSEIRTNIDIIKS